MASKDYLASVFSEQMIPLTLPVLCLFLVTRADIDVSVMARRSVVLLLVEDEDHCPTCHVSEVQLVHPIRPRPQDIPKDRHGRESHTKGRMCVRASSFPLVITNSSEADDRL